MSRLVDGSGRPLALHEELGKGGEGSVFALADPGLCAKVYHKPLPRERADKIRAMAAMRSDALAGLTAWPLSLVSNERSEPVGLVIPRVVGAKDVHRLYSPKSRRADFTRADWRFLIRAASNIARAFGAVHAAGCVIGDVNHGSVLVLQDATVRLIDCDSFQVESGGRRFLCTVGVETYTPPELQGRSFDGVVRSANHDLFGLAVLVFHLLMMGRHPFSGRYHGAGDMPVGRAIEEFRFAYGARRTELLMDRPPGAPGLDLLGTRVADLFERAFSRQGAIAGRPTARDWMSGLDALEADIRQCASNQAHWYHKGQGTCPWCKLEGATGLTLFPLVLQAAAHNAGLDLDALLRQVASLDDPGPVPDVSVPAAEASPEAWGLRKHGERRNLTAFVAALALFVALMAIGSAPAAFILAPIVFLGIRKAMDRSLQIAVFRAALRDTERKRDMAMEEWRRHAGPGEFALMREAFDKAVRELRDVPALRLRKLDQLKNDRRRLQLEAFLDGFDIEGAKIPGVGPGRKSQLASHNVETASDVTPSSIRIPGFGPTTQAKLLAWRGGLERLFVFDATRPVAQHDLMRVEQEVLTDRKKAEDAARMAFATLQQAHARVMAVRQNMRPQVESACTAYAQAKADVTAIS